MNSKAFNVIQEFVRERLDNQLGNIRRFDFSSLRDSGRFGCPGRRFDPADTEIMRAVYEILWGDQLPELSMENIGRKGKYRGITMNSFSALSDTRLERRNVSPELRERVHRFFRNDCACLGNFVVLPGLPAAGTTLSLFLRNRHASDRHEPIAGRFDRFLEEMHNGFRRGFHDHRMEQLIEANDFCFKRFPGEHGFYCLMHLLLLNMYGRHGLWLPETIFPSRESGDFASATTQALEYAERLIHARAEEMYLLLNAKLDGCGTVSGEENSTVAYHQVVQAEQVLIRNDHIPFDRALFRREHLQTVLPELIREGRITPAEWKEAGEPELSGAEWVAAFTELASGNEWEQHCDFNRFSGGEVVKLLIRQPGYFDRCPARSLSQREVDTILRHRPELAEKFRIPDPVGLFWRHANPLREKGVIHTGIPELPPLPDDAQDQQVLETLRELFPEMSNEERIVWEDHIRYNEKTLLGVYSSTAAQEKLEAGMRILGGETHSLEIDPEYRWRNRLLPSLHGRVWAICAGCEHFSLHGRLGKCSRAWGHLGGVIAMTGWDVDREMLSRHSQCPRNGFYFRFEQALLREAETALGEMDSIHRRYVENLRSREIRTAVDLCNFQKALDYCAAAGMTFREYERKHPLVSSLLSYHRVTGSLVRKVRFFQAEGVAIPPSCREALLQLSEDKEFPGCREELRILLGEK